MKDVLVVKFGGSSIASTDLRKWVEAIEKSKRRLVVVPGGGPFAKLVRQYQTRIGYDDDAAHRMAILGMEQFGHALASLGTRLRPAATLDAIAAAHGEGLIPVWMPAKLVIRADEIEHTWSTTSDSLAAWLAGQFEGASLCLIKQIDLPAGSTIEAVSAAGVVDTGFASLLHPATRVFVAGPSDLAIAGRRLTEGAVPGREVTHEKQNGFVEAAQ
ncbi:amino acid kinase [uncultured Aureimonas sp.]|uniref:amino acid kinase family protein n=1 Tax=uncultured Aureimonas sp. TaxID=1604662 RepID=UPI0025F4B9A3|nr:amino acid kinase [uncultured Aureimonas sp.]